MTMRSARPARRHARGRIHTPMAIAMAGSTHDHPVIEMDHRADDDGERSDGVGEHLEVGALDVRRLPRPARSRKKAMRFATRPARATINIRTLSTSGGSPIRRVASTSDVVATPRNRGVRQGGEDLQAVQAEVGGGRP